MNQRIKFIARYLTNEFTFTALCDEFEVSRKTGYKWVRRYDAGEHQHWKIDLVLRLRTRTRTPTTS